MIDSSLKDLEWNRTERVRVYFIFKLMCSGSKTILGRQFWLISTEHLLFARSCSKCFAFYVLANLMLKTPQCSSFSFRGSKGEEMEAERG